MERFDDRLAYNVTWVTLHIMARAMDERRALGFICFVEGLRDLFPLSDVRDTLSAFLKDHPLTPTSPTLKNGRSAFQWTYDLHNYATWVRSKRCGKPAVLMPSLDAVWSLYGPEQYTNNSWGSVFWAMYHYMAANLPPELTHQQYVQWVAFVRGFQEGVPCVKCRDHTQEFLIKHQLSAKGAYQSLYHKGINNWHFSTTLHNEVNARLGKPLMTAGQLEQLRLSMIVDSGSSSGSLICPL